MNSMRLSPASSPTASCLNTLLSQSFSGMRASMERPSSCCCGNLQCAYLEHNNAALEALENQLENAARIGQVSACFFLELCLILQMKQSFQDLCDIGASEHPMIQMLAI